MRGQVGHEEDRAGPHLAGDELAGRQVFRRDFQIAALASGVVAVNAVALRIGHDVQTAVLGRGIDEGDPASDDQALVAVGHEIARILVPWYGTAAVSGSFGTDPVDGGADDLRANQAFDAGEQRGVAQKVEHSLLFITAAAVAHDRTDDPIADLGVVFEEGTEASLERVVGESFCSHKAFVLQGGAVLIDDGGQPVL